MNIILSACKGSNKINMSTSAVRKNLMCNNIRGEIEMVINNIIHSSEL